jgi:sec-independent protein translocase protein TatC
MNNGTPRDADDFFAETRMSFGDHIEDLRRHLWRAILGFCVGLFLSFFIGHYVVRFITRPVKAELDSFYNRRAKKLLTEQVSNGSYQGLNQSSQFRAFYIPRKQLEAIAKGKNPDMDKPRIITEDEQMERVAADSNTGSWWHRNVSSWWYRWFGEKREDDPANKDYDGKYYEIKEQDKDKELAVLWLSVKDPLFFNSDFQQGTRAFLDSDNPSTLNVTEAFMVWFKVCMVCGIIIGSPWIFWQIWMFVAAGLYPHEKRLVHVYLPVSLFLFLAGAVVCELLVIPKAIEALLWFNEWMGMRPDMRLNEWLSFAIFMPLVFGISFQTPLVMLFLARLGIMDIESFRSKRRIAWFTMAVFAAVITPSVDALSMLFLWVPMSMLYELGIFLIRLSPPPLRIDEDVPEPDALVEV